MFSSLVTATKTRYASLRAGDEADGDTEDDSHISRVLRNYYTEQGRPFPPWLGGGPQAQQQQQGVGLRRGQNPGGPQQGVKTTLSDIWDTPASQQKPGTPVGAVPQVQGQKPADGMNKMRFFRRDHAGSNGSQQMQHGQHGHQSQGSSGYDEPPPNQAAQSSIRDRLWSNRSGGNQAAVGRTPSPQLSAPPPPPKPQQQYQAYNGGSGASKGYGGRDKSPARANGYGGNGSRSGNDRPVMSATISFGQDDYEFGGHGGYSGTGGGRGGSMGGSSGGYRRGPPLGGGKVGLPSGPKMHR
ncbi:Sec1-binding region of Mso1-domain-containing protein [Tirmania nivea]|nr:Sec1-binding region of Mso1-domain-containing protein [Tirmania nivea]